MPYKDKEKRREASRRFAARWRKEHPEQVRANNRKYRSRFRDKQREYMRKWRAENRERMQESQRQWRARNPDKVRAASKREYALHGDWLKGFPPDERKKLYLKKRLREHYGLTIEQYERMLADQNGVCASCRGGPTHRWNRLMVDHNHATGKIRGLLCGTCNFCLHYVEEHCARIESLRSYLKLFDS